jgi:hypothetical protein
VVKADTILNEKLSVLKKEFYFEYGGTNEIHPACDTPGSITVACFFAREEMEATFIRWIQRICSQFQCFPVTLNNYSGFPEHTIHLRVQELTHFNAFARQLEPVNAFITACDSQLRVVNYPYLPVATELPEHIYAQAIVNYSQQTFHETFMANELILLKRDNPFEEFKTVTVFNFLPAPEAQVA